MPVFKLTISDKKLDKPIYEFEVSFTDKEWDKLPEGMKYKSLMDFEEDIVKDYLKFDWEEICE